MKTALIVDDEQIVGEVLQRILVQLGFDAAVAESGETALNQFHQKDYDIILMDVLMPGKNGFEIAKEMRQIRPEQKIVMVTGLGCRSMMSQNDEDAHQSENFLSKPFSFEKVRSAIDCIEERNVVNSFCL